MRLLITRPEDDARPMAAALAGRGIDSLIEPLLAIELLEGPALDVDGVQALLITSANGARAAARRTARRDVRVFAVGDASARAARDAGFADVRSAGGDVADLARLVAAEASPAAGALVHVAGSHVAGDLAGMLEGAGFIYRRVVLYAARPAESLSDAAHTALAGATLDGVLFFSPRTAATFVSLVEAAALSSACARLTAYCLSQAVAERVAPLAWAGVVVAARPEQAALLAALDHPVNGPSR